MAGLSLALATACGGEPDAPLNVLLISIDSLRADHVGALGYPRDTTPTLDRLASEGAVFTQAISTTSWTLPAHVALLTGMTDPVHGVTGPRSRLGDEATTLPEIFSQAGYRTVGFYAGPYLHPDFGFGQGFDEYVDCTSYQLGASSVDPSVHDSSHADITNPIVRREVAAALERDDGRPFFFFVHMWDVHYDLVPPAGYVERFDPEYDGAWDGSDFRHSDEFRTGMEPEVFERVLALYDAEIRYTDDTIAEILDELEAAGLMRETLVVVTADHGDEFLEHGGKGHRHTLYEELLRVPLVLWCPERVPVARVDRAVGLVDVAPTILDLAGLPPLPDATGRSLTRFLRGDADVAFVPVLSVLDGRRGRLLSALRHGDEKVILDHETDQAVYYDLARDPGEREPRAAAEHERAAVLVDVLRRLLSEARDETRGTSTADVDPWVEERLRALGYVE